MSKSKLGLGVLVIMLLLAAFAVTGCQTSSGSKEFIPGKGWINTD